MTLMSKPVESKRIEPKATATKPADAKAVATKPVAAKPAEPKAVAPKVAEAKPAESAKSLLHKEIDKLVVDITRHSELKKTVKTEILHEVKEIRITGEDKKTFSALVLYLPFVYVKNHRALLAKVVNEVQLKKKMPAFVLSQRSTRMPSS